MAKKELKPEEVVEKNWMVLKFDYSTEYVVSVSKGTKILEMLDEAYTLNSDYGKEPTIIPLSATRLEARMISSEEYKRFRLNHILGVNDVDKTDE